ncbi:hypothetical protein GCM10009780_32940 [Actinomadura alba]
MIRGVGAPARNDREAGRTDDLGTSRTGRDPAEGHRHGDTSFGGAPPAGALTQEQSGALVAG